MLPLKQLITSGLAIYICTASAFATEQDGRDIDYDEINSYVALFAKAQSPLVKSSVKVSVKSDNLKLSDVEISLVKNGSIVQRIPIDKDGNIVLPVFSEEEAEDYQLHINQPKGSVGLSVNYGINAPEKSHYEYNELFVLLDDANMFIDEMSGMASMFAPTMDALEFEFEEPAVIEILSKSSSQLFKTDEDLKIILERNDDYIESNPTIIFKTLPKSISPKD